MKYAGKRKSKDGSGADVYIWECGREESELMSQAVFNVYSAIPMNIISLHPTKARARNIYKIINENLFNN